MDDLRVLSRLVDIHEGLYNKDIVRRCDPVAVLLRLTNGPWKTAGVQFLTPWEEYQNLKDVMRTSSHHFRRDIALPRGVSMLDRSILVNGQPVQKHVYTITLRDGREAIMETPTDALYLWHTESSQGGAGRIIYDPDCTTVFQGYELREGTQLIHCFAYSDTTHPRLIGMAACMYAFWKTHVTLYSPVG